MNELTQTQDADALLAADRPTWIFKHSVTCPIATRAHAEFEAYIADHADEPAGIVIVQSARDVSNHIAKATGVRHESPQVLLVKEGQVLFHTSHSKITRRALADAMADAS